VYEVFKKLDSLKANEAAKDEEVTALRFEAGAQEIFDAWRDDLEQRLRSEEMTPTLEAHVAKYRSLMSILALLFELIDTEGFPVGVGKTAALGAVACGASIWRPMPVGSTPLPRNQRWREHESC